MLDSIGPATTPEGGDRMSALDGSTGVRPTVIVQTYPDYVSAQRAVDYLSDSGFPVEHCAIVGTGLRLVEKVLGRITTVRAALAGAGAGAWFGFLIGLLFAIFSVALWWLVLLVALLVGAVGGAIFGAVTHAVTGGRRDFTSVSALEADQHALMIDEEYAEQALRLLSRFDVNRERL
jgi:hypothetical protein